MFAGNTHVSSAMGKTTRKTFYNKKNGNKRDWCKSSISNVIKFELDGVLSSNHFLLSHNLFWDFHFDWWKIHHPALQPHFPPTNLLFLCHLSLKRASQLHSGWCKCDSIRHHSRVHPAAPRNHVSPHPDSGDVITRLLFARLYIISNVCLILIKYSREWRHV